jgi:fumarate hydratase class II
MEAGLEKPAEVFHRAFVAAGLTHVGDAIPLRAGEEIFDRIDVPVAQRLALGGADERD